MNNRQTGAEKEDLAAEYLSAQGMKIVHRNYRNRQGEIDIIGYHQGYLVFTEVKFRRNASCGSPLAAVDIRKQQQICKVADYYRYSKGIPEGQGVRYDVVSIEGEKIEWLPNAFMHTGRVR